MDADEREFSLQPVAHESVLPGATLKLFPNLATGTNPIPKAPALKMTAYCLFAPPGYGVRQAWPKNRVTPRA